MSSPKPRTTSGLTSHLPKIGMAGPVAIMVVIPLLVVATGLFVAFADHRAMGKAVNQQISARFLEQTQGAQRSLHRSLERTDTLIKTLEGFATEHGIDDRADLFQILRALMAGVPDATSIGIGEENGNLRMITRDAEGMYLLDERMMQANGMTARTTFRMDDKGTLQVVEQNPQYDYDPRKRAWYAPALANGHTWSKPYVFAASKEPGLTRSAPWKKPDGQALGVFFVDYGLGSLSKHFAEMDAMPGERFFIISNENNLLAHSDVDNIITTGTGDGDQLLKIDDAQDATLSAAVKHPKATALMGSTNDEPVIAPLHLNREEYLLCLIPLSKNASGLRWFLGAHAPTQPFRETSSQALMESVFTTIAAVLLATGVAVGVATLLVRSQKREVAAKAEAKAADARAKALGSYKLVKRLGEGGMGEVWRGEHTMLARPAAVKVIRAEVIHGDVEQRQRTLERFQREAQATASLTNPHTVELYDFGVSDDGSFFYVMELLDGMDLDDLVREHGPLPLGRAIELLIQACSSLGEAHRKGMVHRDIKPANIYCCRIDTLVDQVKVLDFGLVITREENADKDKRLTMEGKVTGTPAYMAPEHIMGEAVDGRADVYALGCVAFYLLTGRNVFEGLSGMSLLMAHIEQPPTDITSVREEIPEKVGAIIEMCLDKDPANRPASMEEFATLLRSVEVAEAESWTREQAEAWWKAHMPVSDFLHGSDDLATTPDMLVRRAEV